MITGYDYDARKILAEAGDGPIPRVVYAIVFKGDVLEHVEAENVRMEMRDDGPYLVGDPTTLKTRVIPGYDAILRAAHYGEDQVDVCQVLPGDRKRAVPFALTLTVKTIDLAVADLHPSAHVA